MKYGLLITVLFSLIASVGHCNTDIAVTIDSLDTLYANRQYDSLIALGQTAAKLAEETGETSGAVDVIIKRAVEASQSVGRLKTAIEITVFGGDPSQ